MPGLSLAFPHIYIHRNSICPHWKYSAQCVYRQSFFSVCGLCRWAGVGLTRRDLPQPAVFPDTRGHSDKCCGVPGEECHSHPASPHQGLCPLSATISPEESCLSKDTFSVELCEIPTEKQTGPKPAPQWVCTSTVSLSLCPGSGQEDEHSRDAPRPPSSHPPPPEVTAALFLASVWTLCKRTLAVHTLVLVELITLLHRRVVFCAHGCVALHGVNTPSLRCSLSMVACEVLL